MSEDNKMDVESGDTGRGRGGRGGYGGRGRGRGRGRGGGGRGGPKTCYHCGQVSSLMCDGYSFLMGDGS